MLGASTARRLGIVLVASTLLAPCARAQAPLDSGSETGVALPSPPADGVRFGITGFGGWNSNALDVSDGPSDWTYDLGASLALGKRMRRGVFGAALDGSWRGFREFEERNTWRGAALMVAGWRPSRTFVLGITGGANYDYADNFTNLDGLALPRRQALRYNGEARFGHQLARRTRWISDVRYEGVAFESGTLTDTESTQARTGLFWRLGARDEVSMSYRYLIARWDDSEDQNHSALLGWRHRLSRRWELDLQPGVTLLRGARGEEGDGDLWRPVGVASISRQSERSVIAFAYRRFITAGYGFGRFQYSETFEGTASLPLGNRVTLGGRGVLNRSWDPETEAILGETVSAEARLAAQIHRHIAVVLSYRYRHRDYAETTPVESHRVGLAVSSVFESRRAQPPALLSR